MSRQALQRLAAHVARQASGAAALTVPGTGKAPAASLWTLAQGGSARCSSGCSCRKCASATSLHRSHQPCCRCAACGTGMLSGLCSQRAYASLEDSQSKIDAINDRFTEAREEISIAQDDAETTYFDESHAEAQKVVGDALEMYTELVNSLEENERGTLQRQMGLKMEQLKQELALLDTLHD